MATTTSLEASVEARLSTVRQEAHQWRSGGQQFTIFRVPADVRESNRTSYEPRVVSIGPYYHGATSLRAMEDQKWRYLDDLLCRNASVSSSLLIQEMRSLEPRARSCYSERPDLDSDDFVRMLLLDACFILEFYFKWYGKEPDALCDVGWGLTFIHTDLLLLENQIPFFVVERLYGVVAGPQGDRETLVNLFLEYIGDEKPIERPSATFEIHHLLHLYYESFVPKRRPQTSAAAGRKKKKKKKLIPRATEMSAAGVTFRQRALAQDMYDVAFDGRTGVMQIPAVLIDEMKRSQLLNLLAFEQSQGAEEANVVTSYVFLMSLLIRTVRDVELLSRRGILENLLANDEEAARFFSHLGDCGTMNFKHQVFAGLYDDVRGYCDSWWHRNRAAFKRDYFSSPWSAISFGVAGFVVVLTAIQSYFTVFPRKS